MKVWRRRKRPLVVLCRQFGISRKTAYKWARRFEENGRRGLGDRRRVARRVHNRPAADWLERVRKCRRRYPTWGAKKLHKVLCDEYGKRGVPSEAAIGRWLRQWQLTRKKRKRRSRSGPILPRPHLTQARRPNDVWSVDHKGWFCTGDHTRITPLTVRDMASCYMLAAVLVRDQSVTCNRRAFARIFAEYGLPRVIRVDNGCPFGADGALGLTRLSAWWVKLGIHVEFITPGCPGENGSHEQMHRVYKDEVASPPAPTLRAQKQRTQQWLRRYNEVRPHEALDMRKPTELYRHSPRQMPRTLPSFQYPLEWESRRVRGNGMICLAGVARYIGEAFEGERIGLKPSPNGWHVYFGRLLVGELRANETTGIYAARYRTSRHHR